MLVRILAICLVAVSVAACSSKPPVPPEPTGPLYKVNVNQPHATYQEREQ